MQLATNNSAQRVKLSVYQLNCLTAHPVCVARFAAKLSEGVSFEELSFFPQADPPVALAVINLCREKNITIDFKNLDFAALLKKLSRTDILNSLLNLKIHNTDDSDFLSLTAELIRHSGIRAFAAKLISQKTNTGTSEALAAALFANVGLFALAQLFTKSILMISQESKEQKISLAGLEEQHLGITDNILSRMLLEKWQFGSSIADSAWLYPIDTNSLTDRLPSGKIVSIVRLADMLAGSEVQYDIEILKQQLSLTDSDIEEIEGKIQSYTGQLNDMLGLEINNPGQFYSETLKQIYLNQLTALRSEDIFSEFIQKFTAAVNSQFSIIDITQLSAKIISECFLVQSICVFTADSSQSNVLLASIIDGTYVKSLLINCPDGFSISQAGVEDLKPWFYEQIGIDSEKSSFIPIKSGEHIIAGIIFRGPVPDKDLLEQIIAVLANAFAVSSRCEHEKLIAQAAVDCLGQSKPQPPAAAKQPIQPIQKDDLAQTAAELAAGAAHELNNPLAVISGRAQLLAQSETDETKKLILNQIIERAGEVHEIVGQLMSYARPAPAKIRTVSPFVVINNSLEKVNTRYHSEPLDIKLENIELLGDIKVDAEQVAEAIAQIIYNALESYESGNGTVHIIGNDKARTGFIKISIKDNGCGMSEETLQKATQPFFSDKSAGRQRGMGLSLAASFLKNSGCTLAIESQPDKGTTVTINLPQADKSENSPS